MLHHRYLMLKFSEMLILACRRMFSAFCLILHETFSSSYCFHLIQEFNLFSPHLVLYGRKHFCSTLTNLSNLSHSRWPFLFRQKFSLLSSDLKNALTKHFPKMQPFANILQNRCYYKFSDIHKKISVLESLFNKVTGLMCFAVNITKCLRKAFFMECLWWLLLKMVEEFL